VTTPAHKFKPKIIKLMVALTAGLPMTIREAANEAGLDYCTAKVWVRFAVKGGLIEPWGTVSTPGKGGIKPTLYRRKTRA